MTFDENTIPVDTNQVFEDDEVVNSTPVEDVVDTSPADLLSHETEHKTNKVEKRIKRLTQKLAEKDRQIEEILKSIPPQVEPTDTKPKLDDFQTYDDYVEALTDYKVNQLKKNIPVSPEVTVNPIQESYNKKVEEFTKTVSKDEFREAVEYIQGHLNDPDLQEMILTSDVGPELLFSLSENDVELERFSKMSKARKLAFLQNYEDKIVENKKVTPKQKTPTPISKLSNGQSKSNATVTSYSEWKAQREASLKKR